MSAASSTVMDLHEQKPKNPRRWFFLAVFCIAQFIDIYSASGTVLAIPKISEEIAMTVQTSIWVISGYALAFGSLLLASGRLADVWNAKYTFVLGLTWLGAFSLGLGFVKNVNGLIVLRVIQGMSAALTIPSAINLIVHIFEDPTEQALAISVFGASGALANVLGLTISAVLLLANYKWIFYLITIIVWPMAIFSFFIIPNTKSDTPITPAPLPDIEAKGAVVVPTLPVAQPTRKPKMDYLGTITMTSALTLLIYGLTQANVAGWKSAGSISTIVIGFLLFPVFFYVETRTELPIDALIPPRTWFLPNFATLTILALAPSFWFFAVQSSLSERMQLLGASPLLVACRFLPQGITAIITVGFLQAIPFSVINLKWRIVGGALLGAGSALMISFAKETVSYWALLFPAFIIGPIGIATLFISFNVAIVMSVPPEASGVAGGVYNSMLQIGVAVGLAITTTLQTSYRGPNPLRPDWAGYRYSFLFVVAVFLVVALVAAIFLVDPLKTETPAPILEPSSTVSPKVEDSEEIKA